MDEVPLPNVPEYSRSELMNMERETTGLYLTGHPMDEYRSVIRKVRAASIGAINSDFASETGPQQFSDDQRVTLACVVTAVKTKTTRNNSLMAYVSLEDDTGSIEMLVFSKVLGECGSYLKEGTALLVKGKILSLIHISGTCWSSPTRSERRCCARPASPWSWRSGA